MDVKEVIGKLAEYGFEAGMRTVTKNGVKKTGIFLRTQSGVSPMLYLEDFSGSAEKVAGKMASVFGNTDTPSLPVDKKVFEDPVWVRQHVCLGLQRTSDECLLKKESGFPGIDKYIYLEIDPEMAAKVTPELLKLSGVTEDEAWKAAEQNTFREGKTIIRNMLEMLGAPADAFYGGPALYVITNRDGFKGSSAVLDREAIRKYFAKDGFRRFVVLPSSVNECILIPVSDDAEIDLDTYNAMIREVNASEVLPEDQLGDTAFELVV